VPVRADISTKRLEASDTPTGGDLCSRLTQINGGFPTVVPNECSGELIAGHPKLDEVTRRGRSGRSVLVSRIKAWWWP
jgi:hypothetical protein